MWHEAQDIHTAVHFKLPDYYVSGNQSEDCCDMFVLAKVTVLEAFAAHVTGSGAQ